MENIIYVDSYKQIGDLFKDVPSADEIQTSVELSIAEIIKGLADRIVEVLREIDNRENFEKGIDIELKEKELFLFEKTYVYEYGNQIKHALSDKGWELQNNHTGLLITPNDRYKINNKKAY